MRCALRVAFQPRLLYCKVATSEVARQLGDRLYQDVVVEGAARWLKNNWRIVSFMIRGVSQPQSGSLSEAFRALHEAGGKGWDEIDDPRSCLEEVGET
jgi:hypothetical protein